MSDKIEHNGNPRMLRPKPIELERSKKSNEEKQR
jgi:hypothetical protein